MVLIPSRKPWNAGPRFRKAVQPNSKARLWEFVFYGEGNKNPGTSYSWVKREEESRYRTIGRWKWRPRMSGSMKRQVEFGRVVGGRGKVGNVLPMDTSVKVSVATTGSIPELCVLYQSRSSQQSETTTTYLTETKQKSQNQPTKQKTVVWRID